MTNADLIARLEAGEGRDAELDGAIHRQLIGFNPDMLPTAWPDIGQPPSPFPPYTTSLDASISLVEKMLPGWWISMERFSDGWYVTLKPHSTKPKGFASQQMDSPARALCAALLRALEDQRG